MAFLRSSGLPIPEVYGYSPVPDNATETAYIFMEFVQGTQLSDSKVFGNRSRVGDTCHHFEAIAHGDEESTVKPTLGEFFQIDDIIKTLIDGLCGEST